jgi:TetR/AcrR family transcriptional regulator, transcriptional repressor for nem operon
MAESITPEVLAQADLRGYVHREISQVMEGMMARLTADKEAGLLKEEFDPQVVVPVIITYLQGVWRMALISYDRYRFEQQMDVFLTGLGL